MLYYCDGGCGGTHRSLDTIANHQLAWRNGVPPSRGTRSVTPLFATGITRRARRDCLKPISRFEARRSAWKLILKRVAKEFRRIQK